MPLWTSIAIGAALLWAISLLLPAVQPEQDTAYPGYMILLLGPMGALAYQFGWFANLALFPSWYLLMAEAPGRTFMLVVAVVLTVLLVDALFWREMYYDSGARAIEHYRAGYFLWFASGFGTAAALFTRAYVLQSGSA